MSPILYAGLASFLYGQAQRSMGPFREHLYILSLITLIDRHILQALPQGHQGPPEPSQASSPMGASTSSAQRATFPGAANLPGPAPTHDQALEIVRVHGYLPVKLDSLFDILDTTPLKLAEGPELQPARPIQQGLSRLMPGGIRQCLRGSPRLGIAHPEQRSYRPRRRPMAWKPAM